MQSRVATKSDVLLQGKAGRQAGKKNEESILI